MHCQDFNNDTTSKHHYLKVSRDFLSTKKFHKVRRKKTHKRTFLHFIDFYLQFEEFIKHTANYVILSFWPDNKYS